MFAPTGVDYCAVVLAEFVRHLTLSCGQDPNPYTELFYLPIIFYWLSGLKDLSVASVNPRLLWRFTSLL